MVGLFRMATWHRELRLIPKKPNAVVFYLKACVIVKSMDRLVLVYPVDGLSWVVYADCSVHLRIVGSVELRLKKDFKLGFYRTSVFIKVYL